jgi:hypothetical protein
MSRLADLLARDGPMKSSGACFRCGAVPTAASVSVILKSLRSPNETRRSRSYGHSYCEDCALALWDSLTNALTVDAV